MKGTFHLFRKSNIENKQRYLDATTKLLELTIRLDGQLGAVFCSDVVQFYGDWTPALFGGLLRDRRLMEEIAFLLKNIKDFHTEIPVFLVEGKGDVALLRTFRNVSQI